MNVLVHISLNFNQVAMAIIFQLASSELKIFHHQVHSVLILRAPKERCPNNPLTWHLNNELGSVNIGNISCMVSLHFFGNRMARGHFRVMVQ